MPADKIDRNAPGAVFVGNISYETSEQDLHDLMSEVGPIKAMKLVINRDTGSHKGFGFVEYHSEAHAKSAMANLGGKDLGGRKIRVDYANQNSKGGGGPGGAGAGGGAGGRGAGNDFQQNSRGGGDFGGGMAGSGSGGDFGGEGGMVRRHHSANQVPAGPSQHQAVRNALSGLSVYQLYDVLKQMKELCQKKPNDAERILLSKPSLAQALLQAQHLLGMVHTSAAGLDLPRDPNVVQTGEDVGGTDSNMSSSSSSSSQSSSLSMPMSLSSSSSSAPSSSDGSGPVTSAPTGGAGGRDRRPLPPQKGLHHAPQQLPPGQPPLLMPSLGNQGGPPPGVRGVSVSGNGGGQGAGRRSASAQRGGPPPQHGGPPPQHGGPPPQHGGPPLQLGGLPPQQRMPPGPAPPGMRIIAGFDNPVPENLVQQALSLSPAQIQQLQPQQQRTIQMIRQAVQQQSYGGYGGAQAGVGGGYGGPPPPGGYQPPPRRY